jgi:hypothetical protein
MHCCAHGVKSAATTYCRLCRSVAAADVTCSHGSLRREGECVMSECVKIAALRLNGLRIAAEQDGMLARGCSRRTNAHQRCDAKIMNNPNVVQVHVHNRAESRRSHAADGSICECGSCGCGAQTERKEHQHACAAPHRIEAIATANYPCADKG